MQVNIKILHPAAKVPNYATLGSAGLDLRAMIEDELVIHPGEVQMVGTGLAVHLDDRNYAAVILPRSGLGSKGLVLGNLVGLIDSDYQGELKICLWNRGKDAFAIAPLDRIAQLVIIPVMHAEFNIVEEFISSERGEGGFNSTGNQ